MEQLLCRMVKDQVTQTFLCGRMGCEGWSTPVITYLYFDPIDSSAGKYKPALNTPRDNGPYGCPGGKGPQRCPGGLYRYVTRTNVSFFDPIPNDQRTEHSYA